MKLKIDFDGLGGEEYRDSTIDRAKEAFRVDAVDVAGLVVTFSGNEQKLRRLFFDIFDQQEIDDMAFYSLTEK
ncbi:MAG: hypothetical protein IJR44_06305 [Neisseriaceae bacterium]|nr:hypothetical protein [Neisseriaceae bacterium]